jgi:hypothetical protein
VASTVFAYERTPTEKRSLFPYRLTPWLPPLNESCFPSVPASAPVDQPNQAKGEVWFVPNDRLRDQDGRKERRGALDAVQGQYGGRKSATTFDKELASDAESSKGTRSRYWSNRTSVRPVRLTILDSKKSPNHKQLNKKKNYPGNENLPDRGLPGP